MSNPENVLDEIKKIIDSMDKSAPLRALQTISDLLVQNSSITNEACGIIERSINNATVEHRRSIFLLLDYLFERRYEKVINYFYSRLPDIVLSYYESADDRARSEIARLVGKWNRRHYLPQVMIDNINRIIRDNCGEEYSKWYYYCYQFVERPPERVPPPQNDFMLDNTTSNLDESEINPSFVINSELLNETVYSTLQSHFEYVKKVFLYHLAQNKQRNMAQPVITPLPKDIETGPMHFTFDWSDDKKKELYRSGREYWFNLRKRSPFRCEQCGMLFKKETEYKFHLENHIKNNGLFEKQKVSRGWYLNRADWTEVNKVIPLSKKDTEPSARLRRDVKYLFCDICGERLEVENVDDGVNMGLFYKDAVRPDPNGPVYHQKCYLIREKQKKA